MLFSGTNQKKKSINLRTQWQVFYTGRDGERTGI